MTYHTFDIDDKTRDKTKPHLTEQKRQHDKIAKDNRKFINAVVRILRTGSLWRDLPLNYEKCGTRIKNLLDGKEKAFGKNYLRHLIFKGNKKLEWLMTDLIYVKDHQHLCDARGENQAISKTKRCLIRKYI